MFIHQIRFLSLFLFL